MALLLLMDTKWRELKKKSGHLSGMEPLHYCRQNVRALGRCLANIGQMQGSQLPLLLGPTCQEPNSHQHWDYPCTNKETEVKCSCSCTCGHLLPQGQGRPGNSHLPLLCPMCGCRQARVSSLPGIRLLPQTIQLNRTCVQKPEKLLCRSPRQLRIPAEPLPPAMQHLT